MSQNNDLFNRHWSIYQSVLSNNAMFHKEFAATAREVFREKARDGALDILDLGCGDAGHILSVLEGLPVHNYTGYDLSAQALDIAHARLATAIPVLHLLQGPMEDLIRHESSAFDIIYSGYAVHHLSDEGKQQILRDIWRLLKPGGIFFLVDVFRQSGQTREDYIDSMSGWIGATWTFLDREQQELIFEHLRGYDHPATRNDLTDWGNGSGYSVNWIPEIDTRHHGVVLRKTEPIPA